MKEIRTLVLAVVFLAFFSFVAAQGLDPGNPLMVKGIAADLNIIGNGTISGPINSGDSLTLKVLVPQSSNNQSVTGYAQELNYNGSRITGTGEKDGFGNKYAVFDFGKLSQAQRGFNYVISARIETSFGTKLFDYNVAEGFPDEAKPFIQATPHAESNDATIRTIASNAMKSDSELESIGKATEWANNYLEYDAGYWGRNLSAIQALESKRGVCVEYSNLAAALLKAKGIPVRFVSGMVYSSLDWNNHAWLEAYVPGTGWVGVDPTYGEAGLIDGTHIEIGKSDDYGNAADQSYSYVGDFNVNLSDSRQINVISIEKFPALAQITPTTFSDSNEPDWNESVGAGKQFDLNAVIANKTNEIAILPAQLSMHSGFTYEKPKKLLVLKPLEETEVSWKAIAPDANADYAYGYRIESIGSAFEGYIPVKKENGGGNSAGIIVKESAPEILADGSLQIKMKLFNASKQISDLNISVVSAEGKVLSFESRRLLPLESREFSYKISDAFSHEFVFLKVNSAELNYGEKINISKGVDLNSGSAANPGEANRASGESQNAVRAKEFQAIGQKGESFLKGLTQSGLIVPVGIIIILLFLLLSLRKAFH
ncbi:MAG: transglutaminase family protein [archaeon]